VDDGSIVLQIDVDRPERNAYFVIAQYLDAKKIAQAVPIDIVVVSREIRCHERQEIPRIAAFDRCLHGFDVRPDTLIVRRARTAGHRGEHENGQNDSNAHRRMVPRGAARRNAACPRLCGHVKAGRETVLCQVRDEY
jgi:hypothetical protein